VIQRLELIDSRHTSCRKLRLWYSSQKKRFAFCTVYYFTVGRKYRQTDTETASILSRSYCYTVWSAIGIILSSVHPSVRLSGRPSVCRAWLSGLMYMAKSCTSVFLAGMFLFVHSESFGAVYIVKPQNAPPKTIVEENASVSFFQTQTTTRVLNYSALLTVENSS